MTYTSGPQTFQHQGPVSCKTIFLWTGEVEGRWFRDDSSALHLLCMLFLLLLHQLYLRSSGIRSWRLGIPDLDIKGNNRAYQKEGQKGARLSLIIINKMLIILFTLYNVIPQQPSPLKKMETQKYHIKSYRNSTKVSQSQKAIY